MRLALRLTQNSYGFSNVKALRLRSIYIFGSAPRRTCITYKETLNIRVVTICKI